jgi:aquaporin Z
VYAAEALGTFALVFIGTSVATLQGFLEMGPAGWLGISFAFGATLMVLVNVIGPISGCHLNPAVTIPMALSGRMKGSSVPGYIIAQLIGASTASFVLLALLKGLPGYAIETHGLGANGNPKEMSAGALLGFEAVMTALFLFTIFSATRDDAASGAAPLAIGGFLFVAHLVGAPLGDSSLNPARSIGPALIEAISGQSGSMGLVWIFIAGPLAGGVVGWLLYKFIYED